MIEELVSSYYISGEYVDDVDGPWGGRVKGATPRKLKKKNSFHAISGILYYF